MSLQTMTSLELTNKKVFLRLDLNVPIKDGRIQDETRITEALPTIRYILERTPYLCIASHLGRPKNKIDPKYTLESVGERLSELLEREVVLYPDFTSEPSSKLFSQLNKGQIVLLENLRFYPGEEENDRDYARLLMEGFDFYINDAFGTCHRAHASVAACAEILPIYKRGAGFLIQKETEILDSILSRPEHPFTVIMGGAKVSDKIAVILNLLNTCNDFLIGGAMAYTFLKYKGITVGSSKTEDDKLGLIETIFRAAEKRRVQIHLPCDHMCASEFVETARAIPVSTAEIPTGLMGLDIGPKTSEQFSKIIAKSKTVLWNGPMGVFEWDAFSSGTMAVAKAMAASKAKTVVGGGDSVSAAHKAGVSAQLTHLSTGGGASLEYLEGQSLPGLKVLMKKA